MRNLRTVLTFLLGWPLSLIALYFLGKTFLSQFSKIQTDLTHINWYFLILSVFLFVLYFFLRSFIWYKLLVFRGYTLEIRESLFHWSFAQLKRYIPGNIWGVLGVSVHFAKKNVTKKEVASTFIIESQIVLISSAFLSLFGLSLFLTALNLSDYIQLITISGVFLVSGGTILYFYSSKLVEKLHFLPRFVVYLLPRQSPSQLVTIWLLMVIALAVYGFGTYFAISSLVYVDVQSVFTITSYFILSLLIGFLSVITPSGLGVREGAIVLGLTQFIPASIAAFAALFARLMLIVGELIFIAFGFILHKVRSGSLDRFLTWVEKHPHAMIVALMYILFSWYFSFISFLRFDNYYTGRFDLGNMVQTVWNTAHGRIFEFTNPDGVNIASRLAFHADFILVLFAPFFLLWQDPRLLLLLQALITGAGVFFVYLLARDILNSPKFALVFSFLYIINPSIQRSVIYDFHAVTLATTFLLGAFYFLYKRKYVWFAVFALLAAFTKEQIWAIIALFGLYIALIQGKRKLGIAVTLLSVLSFYVLLWHFIPWAAGQNGHFALSYYSNGEDISSPTQLLLSYIQSPEKITYIITDEARVSYLNQLFSPLGYLPLLAPGFILFALPDLTINILSAKPQLYQIYYQYTTAITPFLFIAAIFGARLFLSRGKLLLQNVLVIYLLSVGLYTAYLYGPLPQSKDPNLDMITKPILHKSEVDKIVLSIPEKYSVSATNDLGSQLAQRRRLYTFPNGWDDADFVIFSMKDVNSSPYKGLYLNQLQKLEKNPHYQKLTDNYGLVVFQKNTVVR